MDHLCRILGRAHCRYTHQRLAVDALSMLGTDAGKRLTPWLLRYSNHYLRGAIDPDLRFRDFHNHILHVRDGCWGGAPRVAQLWYQRLQKYLRRERLADAAHAAGVLTHYLTDLIQPLHTINDHREAIVHRPFEWSVHCCYDRIRQQGRRSGLRVQVKIADHPHWLGSLMIHAARHSTSHATELTRGYRFNEGVKKPSRGLDDDAIDRLAELFELTLVTIAAVLDRAATEAESFTGYSIPSCGLKWATTRAVLSVPFGVGRKIWRVRQENRTIRNLAQEYFQDGKLTDHLPDEVDIKRRVIEVYHRERCQRAFRRQAA